MDGPARITGALLDVLEILLNAMGENREPYGWEIKKRTRRSGATTYKMLDRLEDAGWITGRWEASGDQPGKPPRRYYRLTPAGEVAARAVLAERRPGALRRMLEPRNGPEPGPVSPFLRYSRLAGRRLTGGAR